MTIIQPSLFGLTHSNRDFTDPKCWGKNVFNNAFPASLACYMYSKQIEPVYLKLNNQGQLDKTYIGVDELYGANPLQQDLFYAFERDFAPYQPFVIGNLPRTDLVTIDTTSLTPLKAIEIKLTALPDNSTSHLAEERYGCEIVVRPDTIVYLSLSIMEIFRDAPHELGDFFNTLRSPADWTDAAEVLLIVPSLLECLHKLVNNLSDYQKPLVMQPIWKSQGKMLRLHENAFDIFVWSNLAFTKLFFRAAANENLRSISRPIRSLVWLAKMLLDFARDGQMNHKNIIDLMSYNTKNDKAFSVNGMVTQQLMESPELIKPRIRKEEIQYIILGNGQDLLSPERRLDAAILSTTGLFP